MDVIQNNINELKQLIPKDLKYNPAQLNFEINKSSKYQTEKLISIVENEKGKHIIFIGYIGQRATKYMIDKIHNVIEYNKTKELIIKTSNRLWYKDGTRIEFINLYDIDKSLRGLGGDIIILQSPRKIDYNTTHLFRCFILPCLYIGKEVLILIFPDNSNSTDPFLTEVVSDIVVTRL
jgi:hypothetical protein